MEGFTAFLDGDERFHGIPVKTSFTDYPPFNRLNVRKKSEIISVGLDHINPAIFTGPEIEPRDFKALLDRGEAVHVLDTRNDYELRAAPSPTPLTLTSGRFGIFPRPSNVFQRP